MFERFDNCAKEKMFFESFHTAENSFIFIINNDYLKPTVVFDMFVLIMSTRNKSFHLCYF
jgi:hypothetical protein